MDPETILRAGKALHDTLQALADHEHCDIDWSKLDPQDVFKMLQNVRELRLRGESLEHIRAATVKDIRAIFEKCRLPNLHLVLN